MPSRAAADSILEGCVPRLTGPVGASPTRGSSLREPKEVEIDVEDSKTGIISGEIREFVVEEILEGEDIPGDPLELGLLDSLALEIVSDFIREKYGVEFEDEELVAENFVNIGTVADRIESKLQAG
jgi:acyl carrier protein